MRKGAAIVGIAAGLVLGQPALASDVPGGVCGEQIAEDVAKRFGQTVRDIEFRWRDPKGLDSFWSFSEAIVGVNECPGWHWYEITVGDFKCTRQAHLGRVPRYVNYRSSGDGC